MLKVSVEIVMTEIIPADRDLCKLNDNSVTCTLDIHSWDISAK